MDGAGNADDILRELDGAPVPRGWWPDLSATLLQLGQSIAPIDRPILAPLVAYLTRHSRFLEEQAARVAHVQSPSDIHDAHPASATLFRYRSGHTHGLERLTCIGLCSLLEAHGRDRNAPKRLLSMVRGALGAPDSPLTLALGSTSSIPELVRVVDRESTSGALPTHFLQQWNGWLRDTLIRWMLTEPGRLRHALEPPDLTPSLEAPVAPLSLMEGQPESAVALTCFTTPVRCDQAPVSATVQAARGAAVSLERASQGDLLSPPDLRIPRVLDERLCRRTVSQAQSLISVDPTQAERFVALALALGSGVREIDLQDITWGREDAACPHAVDPALPVLYRRLRRPVNAVRPSEHLADWLEPSLEVLAWPLPDSVHRLLLQLAEGGPRPGNAVLPLLAGSITAPYRLHDVLGEVMPEAKTGALAPRLGLASEIAAVLGSEMAQIALADTFAMPAVPAYYSALPESELVTFLAQIQSRRFGEQVEPRIKRAGHVGSRLVLTDPAARCWPARLRHALRTAAREPVDPLAVWRAHRDHLAAVLCCATGHRPEDALGRIQLDDVIPEYGLILLQDKQVDALRATRIAATGRLWLADLRRYLDHLVTMSTDLAKTPAGRLAASILRAEAPLLSAPTTEGIASPVTASALRDSMPPELQSVDNFYRHRLNQCLQRRRVDPELRHAQLGWVVSPAHMHADLSPRAPTELARQLGPVIDDLLVADGWYPASARRTRWHWDGVPMPKLMDWEAVFASHKRQHEAELKRIRLQLHERWTQYEASVMDRLGTAIGELFPWLRLDPEKRRLVPAGEFPGVKVEMTPDHYALICDRVRQGDADPSSALEAVIARILLYRLVRRAREKGLVQGPIPSRPYLSVTADPSPFVPGLGTAVRQVEAVRQALVARAKQCRARDLGALTVWSILAFSMYRRMPWALAATGAARDGLRARTRGHVIRIPATVEGIAMPMVFSGVPATLLARRKHHAPTARPPSLEGLDDWARVHLSGVVGWGEAATDTIRIERTLQAAAAIELSGIERLLLRADTRTAAESSLRCTARDDDWPVHTADTTTPIRNADEVRRQPSLTEVDPIASRQVMSRDVYDRFVSLLNPRTFGRLRGSRPPTRSGRASDGKWGWRGALRKALEKLRETVGSDNNLTILIGYSLDHLRHGSEDGHRLAHNSLQREITQIGWPLLAMLGDRPLSGLTGEELRQLYREVLFAKTEEARTYAFEELHRFHRYLIRGYACPSVDMAELATLAGTRKLTVEPGLLTTAEREATYDALVLDHEMEQARTDTSPDFLRLAQLRRILFLILEASGIRPGSAYGLTLSDLHLSGAGGDFVHVRVTGDYGEAKTSTSIGFVPLEGVLWRTHRAWLSSWLDAQRTIAPDGHRAELPLFAAKPGQRVRFHEDHLTRRINQLLKWASGNPKAHVYWLRKVRVSERYQTLQQTRDVSARDVHGMMTLCGHALIQIPITSYINDPASLHFADLYACVETPRAALLAMSGLAPAPLDMAWSRSDGGGATRISILLDRVGETPVPPGNEYRTEPPPLRRFKPFLPMHIDAYARAVHHCRNRSEAVLLAGLTDPQADRLDEVAHALLLQRGCTPWIQSNQVRTRSTMEVPRRLAGTGKLFGLLAREPSAGLKALVTSWVKQAHISHLYDRNVVMCLNSIEVRDAANLLIDECGLSMQVATINGRHLLKEPLKDDSTKGHRAALCWVLAIVWIFASILNETGPDCAHRPT